MKGSASIWVLIPTAPTNATTMNIIVAAVDRMSCEKYITAKSATLAPRTAATALIVMLRAPVCIRYPKTMTKPTAAAEMP